MVLDGGLIVLAEPSGGGVSIASLETGAPLARIEIDSSSVVDVAVVGPHLVVITQAAQETRAACLENQRRLHVFDRLTGTLRWSRDVVPGRASSAYGGA
jgi:hypothetical protein